MLTFVMLARLSLPAWAEEAAGAESTAAQSIGE